MNVFKMAKAYQRKHPRTEWQDAIQAVSGKKKKPAKRKAAAPRKPAKRKASKRRTKSPGISSNHNRTVTLANVKSQGRELCKEKLARLLLRRDLVIGVRKKRALSKTIAAARKELKMFL